MSDDSTRVMSAAGMPDRTMIVPPGGAAATQMPFNGPEDAFRTQMGGTTTCPVCQTVTPLTETYCGECGYVMSASAPASVELPSEEAPAAELVEPDGRRHRLHRGVNTVGRQGTDVLLTEGTISRNHAQITLEGERITVEDLGSSNGTKVGDLRIGPNQPTVATPGTPIKFGSLILTLVAGTGEAAATVMGGESSLPPVTAGDRTMISLPSSEPIPNLESPVPDPAPVPAGAVALLQKIEGPGADIPLSPGVTSVGRRAGNTLVISTDAYLSGRHAELMADASGASLTDVGSTNGTKVNGQKLTPQQPQILVENDVVELGQTQYRFQPLPPEPQPVSEPDFEDEQTMQLWRKLPRSENQMPSETSAAEEQTISSSHPDPSPPKEGPPPAHEGAGSEPASRTTSASPLPEPPSEERPR